MSTKELLVYWVCLTILIALVSGCSLGPVSVTHIDGSMPKLRLFDDCRVKAKGKVLSPTSWGVRHVTCTYEWN